MTGELLKELRLPATHEFTLDAKNETGPADETMWTSQDHLKVVSVKPQLIRQANGPNALKYACDPGQGNLLRFNDGTLNVQNLHYSVRNIEWIAGEGHAPHITYCPIPTVNGGMKFHGFYEHQIVPVFGGYYWKGCISENASGKGRNVSPVVFWVNDLPRRYNDNCGHFDVYVWGWS